MAFDFSFKQIFSLIVPPSIVAISLLGSLNVRAQETQSTGAKFLDPDVYRHLQVAPIPTSGNIPESATLENSFPRARNQGSLQSCTAWASAYVKAYEIFRDYRSATPTGADFSPDDVFQSPAFLYSYLTQNQCNEGSYIKDALDFFHQVGSIYWDDLPYSETQCPDWKVFQARANNRSDRNMRISQDDPLGDIKNFISHGDPVILAIEACKELKTYHKEFITTVDEAGSCGGHAIVAVGYDDRLQAVRLLNSWGPDWGKDGKAWVAYSVLTRRLREGYVDFGPRIDDVVFPHAAVVHSTLTPEILVKSLRSSIGPDVLTRLNVGESQVEVRHWAIWLNLPEFLQSQVVSVDYYFEHPSFHNPKHSEPHSNIFIAQWRGWGCTERAHLIAKTVHGSSIRADFDFCDVVNSQLSSSLPSGERGAGPKP